MSHPASHPAVTERLARLAPDQRAAATIPPGPVLCVAPAGSGKTTTLVARIAWLVDGGVDPASIATLTFNRRAAEELDGRLATALEPLGVPPGAVRVRTFHALGREILRDAGVAVERLVDRETVLRELDPAIAGAMLARLDTAFSRLKLDLRADPALVAADPGAGPVARAWIAYERALAERGALDFDDLVRRALDCLAGSDVRRDRWRGSCAHLLVDEAQDLDRSQLDLALLLAAPANHLFLVGDDDQSIYGWRLADVRRLRGLADSALPGLTRVDLETNYRCPAVVLERAVRLVEHNVERFAKVIRAGPNAAGRMILAPSAADEVDRATAVLASWPADGGTRAVLARTNRELLPVVAAALRLRIPFRAADLRLPVESPLVDRAMEAAWATGLRDAPLRAVGRVREARMHAALRVTSDEDGPAAEADAVDAALLGWAAGCRDLAGLAGQIIATRALLEELRVDDAPLSLATAHGTKGLEFDHVAVIGLDDGRFPSARSVAEAVEPDRALEEERRLAYVAWTRARRSLTLVFDPGAPSQFLLEAFDAVELGILDPRRTAVGGVQRSR
jgi:superfamily I DNA/RNA helicase